jgi:hypothetical protein
MNLERYKAKVGLSQLTHILDEIGEDGLMSLIVEKMSEGTKPSDVARDLHLPFLVLWNWLAAEPKRQQLYNHGWEMYASDLHAETIQIADEATVEDVQVARLRVDTRFKAASSYDRKRFGTTVKHDVEVVGVDIKQLLEQRRQRIENVVDGVVLAKTVELAKPTEATYA